MLRVQWVIYTLLVFVVSCGAPKRQAWQLTRILQQRCQKSADSDESCEDSPNQRQRLPAIIETDADEQLVVMSLADPAGGDDQCYAGQRDDAGLHFVAQQQRVDPDSDCHYNRVELIDLQIDGELIEGTQSIRVEQSAACTTTGWSQVRRETWLWRGHRLQAADAALPTDAQP